MWQHLVDVVAVLLRERPDSPLELFERISHFVQGGKMVPSKMLSLTNKDKNFGKLLNQADYTWAEHFIHQFAPPKPSKKLNEEVDEEEPMEEEEDKGFLSDILAEADTFKWCGIGLREVEVYRIMVALKKLLDSKPLATVRFWGKVYGLEKDYFICEGELDPERLPEVEGDGEPEEEEEGGVKPTAISDQLNTHKAKPLPVIQPEARGFGTNKYTYFVATTADLTEWIELPNVRPDWIHAARKISKLFTGCLDAPVGAHPPFPGLEKEYLRAQIARIMHTTTVVPRMLFSLTEQAEEEEEDASQNRPRKYTVDAWEDIPEIQPTEVLDTEDEEAAKFKLLSGGYKDDALMMLENWVHFQPPIFHGQARASAFKPEEEEAVDDEEEGERPVPPPPEQVNPRLSDLAHDAKMRFKHHSKRAFPPWAVRKAFHIPSSTTRLYLISSLLWPGAHAYAKCIDNLPGAKHSNIYIGYGIKRDKKAQTFAPQFPSSPVTEFLCHQDGLLQVDSTPDDELEFAKPAIPPPILDDGEEADEEEED